ncbi:YheC/YheD family protein [Paenibacillus donghaensis]|uniref:Endospore coat-associated protein n=1 Tax=Paenibacillus donghaensis TaxID=414771 RepID=A0A2Z2KN77_9BACL|nr:YheC/YheD family protein [Paenibacillus donghaensis]ASA25003.1 hypothetical protein B9T62_32160 [Paenibacillus donghaensis]
MRIQRVSSKWAKTMVLLQNPSLAIHIPDTRKYSHEALEQLLDLYATVYIKPDRGTYGSGVMRAEKRMVTLIPGGKPEKKDPLEAAADTQIMYILRYEKMARIFSSLQELHEVLLERLKGRTYLAQQGIDLLTRQNRPFDLRVLTQKTPAGGWKTTGMLGRVAAPQKIVTNYHSGGAVTAVDVLLKEHMDVAEAQSTISQLKVMGVQMARQLETAYPSIKEIGLDVAVDQHHELWLLEVNTLPSIIAFKQFHKDKRIYRKIQRYATAYGRLKAAKPLPTSKRKKRKSGK